MTDRALSEHFGLAEMTHSDMALRRGLSNFPDPTQVANLQRLCVDLLEPIRALLECPLHINSGFRSHVVNVLVGGATNSAHLDGRAADIVPIGVDLQCAFDEIRRSSLPWDKVLLECGAWLHVQLAPEGHEPQRKAYTASGGPGAWTYTEVTNG